MAKKISRKYNKKDTLHIQQAQVVYTLLYGDGITPGALPDFTAKFPDMDANWLAAFFAAINAADDAPSDDEIVTAQRLSTLTVE